MWFVLPQKSQRPYEKEVHLNLMILQMEQLKFRIITPAQTQRKSTDLTSRKFKGDSLTINNPVYSNISYRKSHKQKALSQGTFYGSPLLAQNQLEMIDKMKQLKRNDFYGQLQSIDPYQYPTKLQELHLSPISPREPTVEVVIPHEIKEPKSTMARFSENLSRHNARDRLHRGIPQKHDIQSLASWVDVMVQQTVDKYGDKKQIDFYDEVQNILTLCLKELIRQISIDCIERSVLLEKIWSQYVEINSSVIKQVLDERREMETSNLKEIMKTHQLYQTEIDNFQLIIKNLKDEQVTLTERLIKLKDNGKYLKKANRNLQNQTRDLRFQLNDVTTTNKYLSSEVENLKSYIEDAEKDMQNIQQQYKTQFLSQYVDNSNSSSPKRKRMNRSGTLFVSPFPQEQQHPESLKILKAGKHKTFFKEQKQEEKMEKALKSDTDSDENCDVEELLKEQGTDTCDLVVLLDLQKEQSTQAFAAAPQIVRAFLLPDTRQEIVQTDMSMNNVGYKETQTELLPELVEVIKTDEDNLMQIQDHLMKVSENYKQIKADSSSEESPKSRRISQFFLSLGEASSKMKQTMHMQREIRTSLLLVNSAQKDDNFHKQTEISQLKTVNDDLKKNMDNVANEIQDLESQLEIQEKINQKLEQKYAKVKDKKQLLIERTQNLVNSFTKTQKFTNIMKKKILDKRSNGTMSQSSPQKKGKNSQNQLTLQIETPQQNQQQLKQQVPPKSATKRPQNLNNSITQNDNSVSSSKNLQALNQSQDGLTKKKWNIHVTNAEDFKKDEDNESELSQSQQSFQQSIYQIQEDDRDILSQRSLNSASGSKGTPLQANKSNIYQLMPASPNPQSVSKSGKSKKNQNLSSTASNNNESFRFISETLKQFINDELDNSDTSSVDSSFSGKLEDFNKRKMDRHQRRKNITQAQAPKFQNRTQNSESTSQLNFQRSQYLVQFLSERFSRNPKSISVKMQKINVLKFIAQFYCEKIKQYSNKNMPLHQICYEYFVNTYGFKSMAEQKLTNFYQSVFVYRENFRVGLFGRFIELFNPLTLDDLENYMQSMKFLDENEIAVSLAQVVNEKGVLVSLERAIASFDSQHSCLPIDVKEKIIKEIRTNTFERKNKLCVDLDFFISKVLTGYHQLKMMHQAHFEEVFYSADMDMDGMIEFQEFQKLYLHFEINQGTKLNEKQIRSQFMERCDTVSNESGEKAMSFDRFVTFSLENNLFSEAKFQQFSKNVDINDPIKNLSDLKDNWTNIQLLLTNRIDLTEIEESQYYQRIISKLDQALHNPELKESYWISYRILDADTKVVYLTRIAEGLLPLEFINIQDLMNDIFDDNISYQS